MTRKKNSLPTVPEEISATFTVARRTRRWALTCEWKPVIPRQKNCGWWGRIIPSFFSEIWKRTGDLSDSFLMRLTTSREKNQNCFLLQADEAVFPFISRDVHSPSGKFLLLSPVLWPRHTDTRPCLLTWNSMGQQRHMPFFSFATLVMFAKLRILKYYKAAKRKKVKSEKLS